VTFNSQAVYACADHYEELAIAAQRVMADVTDYCDDAREEAGRRSGSADPDIVVLGSEISEIQTAIERFRQTWIDRLEREAE